MTYKEVIFTCTYCGKVYKTKNYKKGARSHFCSRECHIKYRAEIKPSIGTSSKVLNCTCDFCGKKFHKVPSAIRETNFCSRQCQNTFLAHKIRDKAQKDLNCTCAYCGKKFHRKQSHVGKIQFCDTKCRDAYREEQRKQKEHEAVCPVCGKSITLDKTRQKNSKSGLFFCSNACIGKYFRGDKSPVYKGSRSILGVLRSYYERYQKKKVFGKYNAVCQICGKKADHVHHIYPLYKIVESYMESHKLRENTTVERYKIAYDIIQEYPIFSDENNLIALCKECHNKQHGKGVKAMNITSIDYGMSDNSYNIFVSGCSANPKCEGCFNPESWDFDEGKDWLNYIGRINKDMNEFKSLINKIIIVGGEPLDQDLTLLEQLIKFLCKFKVPIYLFTRHSLENVPNFVKELCDYIKCGPYIPSLTCNDNIQYGIKLATSNQKIYKKGLDY